MSGSDLMFFKYFIKYYFIKNLKRYVFKKMIERLFAKLYRVFRNLKMNRKDKIIKDRKYTDNL